MHNEVGRNIFQTSEIEPIEEQLDAANVASSKHKEQL